MSGNTTSYTPPVYDSNLAVRTMHGAPRFGHSDQFSLLFSNESSDITDYSKGVLFLGLFLFSVFFSWGICLLVLRLSKCCCNGGVLTGRPMKEPKPTTFPRRTYQTPIWIRSLLLLSCAIVTIFSLIVAADSYFKTNDLVETSRKSLNDVSNLLQTSKNLTESVRDIGNRADPAIAILSEDLDFDTSLCFISNATAIDQGVPDFRSQVDTVQDKLKALKGFINGKLQNLMKLQNRLIRLVDDINYNLDEYGPKKWWFMAFAIPIIVTCTAMSIGTLYVWSTENTLKIYQLILNWILLPIFILFIFVSCIFCGLVGTGSIIISDLCTGNANPGTPDSTFSQIIEYQNWDKDSMLYKGTRYYINRCQTDYPFGFLQNYVNDLRNANKNLGVLSDYFNNQGNVNTLETFCPSLNIKEIQRAILNLGTEVQSLFRRTTEVIDLTACERTNSLYTDITYNITCTQGSRITFFVFVSFIFITFFGLIIITLRSAWLGVEYYDGQIPMEKQIPSILVEHQTGPPFKAENENISKSESEEEFDVEKSKNEGFSDSHNFGKDEKEVRSVDPDKKTPGEAEVISSENQNPEDKVPFHENQKSGFTRY